MNHFGCMKILENRDFFPVKTMTWLQNRIIELQKKCFVICSNKECNYSATASSVCLAITHFFLFSSWFLHLHSLLTTYFFTLLALILSWFQSAKKKKNRHIFTYAFYLVFVQKMSSVVRLFSKEAHGVVVVVK